MKKIFAKQLCIYMIIALFIILIAIFIFQTFISHKDNTFDSEKQLNMVKEKLYDNDNLIKSIVDSISENSLAKARAFALMIYDDPSILLDQTILNDICTSLDVDEVHVTDENGVLMWGSVEDYFGFDFNSGEQTKPFLEILKNPSFELAQEPQPNATLGIYFQYIGVTRIDKPGIVQVGIQPKVLENILINTEISKVLNLFKVGNTGCVFAIDQNNGSVLAYKDSELIGKTYEEAGFPKDILDKHTGSAKINGVSGYYVTDKYNNITIGTFYPKNEYYTARTRQLTIICISMVIVFAALVLLINCMVNEKIVMGIHNITHHLSAITSGNLDITIDEKGNPEFKLLSDSINSMVRSIKNNIEENKNLLDKQKIDMEESVSLVNNIKSICEKINNISQETLSVASNVYSGSEEQTVSINHLSTIMTELTDELKKSAEISLQVADASMLSVQKIENSSTEMNLLYESIEEIADTSSKIQSIINSINEIAAQTNMLSLNASIEAARAQCQEINMVYLSIYCDFPD